MKYLAGLLFVLVNVNLQAQKRIIDMHVHSYSIAVFGEREPPSDHYGVKGSKDAVSHREETFAAFKQFNIVKAAVSGNPQSVE